MASYRLQDPERGILGPVSFATVCDLLRTAVAGADIRISRDSGPFMPVANLAEVATAVGAGQPLTPVRYGNLETEGVLAVLAELARERDSALLVVEDGPIRKDVYIVDGRIVFSTSNVPAERLGQYLILKGILSPEDLQVALESMHTDGNRLAETLVRLGLVDSEEIAGALHDQLVGRLIELACWRKGSFELFRGAYAGDDDSAAVTVMELARHLIDELPEEYVLPGLRTMLPLVPVVQAQHLLEPLSLNDIESAVVVAMNANVTGTELLKSAERDAEVRRRTLALLYVLTQTGIVAWFESR